LTEFDRVDFFISHAGPDAAWAEWVAQQLVADGKTVELDVWDWAAGTSFISATRMALDKAARMVALWSPDYFSRTWAQFEHDAALAKMQEEHGWLVPVLIRPCERERIPAALRPLIYVELVGLPEAEARRRLLGAVDGPRRPTDPVAFPGQPRPVPFPGGLPEIWNVPARNPFFTGRQGLLADLKERVHTASAPAVTLLHGVGGVGKSQLAIEYAWAHAGRHDLVWWVDAEAPATAEAGLVELAAALGTPMVGGAKVVLSQLRAELRGRSGWLLVLDNLADPDVLPRLALPGTGRIVATSRSTFDGLSLLPVEAFARGESIDLLQRRCPGISGADANRLAAALADLPLALGQAAAFLATTGSTVASYLERLPGEPATPDARLAATVRTGLAELAITDPAALELLQQLALLAPEPIPLTAAGPDHRPAAGLVVADPATTTELVSAITGLDLAIQDGTRLVIHRRLRAQITRSMVPVRRRKALGRVLRLLAGADPGAPNDVANWPAYANLLPHVQAADAHCDHNPNVIEPMGFVRLVDRTCEYLRVSGQQRAGHQLADGVHARRQRTLGADHPATLTAADNLAGVLESLGEHEEAGALWADTLERRRRVLGDEHPLTRRTASRLG
jgi:hypothetical protein